jgi:hypothetical protein
LSLALALSINNKQLLIHNKQTTPLVLSIYNKQKIKHHNFRRAAFSAQLKAKVGSTLTKAAVLRINLNIDGTPITSRTHTHLHTRKHLVY